MKKKTTIKLTKEEFEKFQGALAIHTLKVQAIQQEAASKIASLSNEIDKVRLNLVKKYRIKGMRPDVNYSLDEQTHSLVEERD